jgi:uncharacterized ferritin-like protein (DUF455 family)
MSLTFEMANLDFAPLYGASFAKAGDALSSSLMQRILEDEIGHVSFGWRWLKKFKSAEMTEWEAWTSNLSHPLGPQRAKGPAFHAEPRAQAGIPEVWIDQLSKL